MWGDGGGADVSEDAGLSSRERMAWVVQRLDGGFIKGFPGFVESSVNSLPFFFNFRQDAFLVNLERRSGECG